MKIVDGAEANGENLDGGEGEGSGEAAPETELIVAIGKEPGAEAEDDSEIEAPVDDAGTPPSELVRELRKKLREDAKAKRALEGERDAALAAAAGKPKAEPDAPVVGDKPTLESCEYDESKFETELLAWSNRTKEAEAVAQRQADARKDADKVYTDRLTAYRTAAATLKVANFAEAEKTVVAGLSLIQQSILIRHAKNAALVIYALGQDAVKLKELGAVSDPVEFAAKAAFLETEIKAVSKAKFKIDTKPAGNGGGTLPTGAAALDRARAAAEKSGDYTEVNNIKREAKKAAARQGK